MVKGRNFSVRAGFSLLETLTAAFVFCLAAVTLIPSYLATNHAIENGRDYEQAVELAAAQIESLRAGGYANLPAFPASGSFVTLPLSSTGTLPNCTGSVTVTWLDPNLQPSSQDLGRVRIDSTVKWGATSEDSGTVTLSSLMTLDEK